LLLAQLRFGKDELGRPAFACGELSQQVGLLQARALEAQKVGFQLSQLLTQFVLDGFQVRDARGTSLELAT
jgi:hypothetical protein